MKNTSTLIFVLLFSATSLLAQDTLVWLKNNAGIIENNSGAVIRWENQIEGLGDATQSNPALGGEQMQESYPGKVNVAFSNAGSFLELEGSNAYFLDNSFSVFYVGKVGDVGSVATLIGNLTITGNWNNCSGLRFVRKSNGDLAFQYGRPNYKHLVLNTLPEDAFFFFGFSIDNTGSYTYFDNSSPILKHGTIDGEIFHNTNVDHKLNLHGMVDEAVTYDHTEVAEVVIVDDKLSDAALSEKYTALAKSYPELIKSEFSVEAVTPTQRTKLGTHEAISVSFSQPIDTNSTLPNVYVNKSENATTGHWSVANNTIRFVSSEPWPLGALVTVKLDENLSAVDGTALELPKRTEYNFLVETDTNFGADTVIINAMATVDFPQAGHKLPLKLVLPSQRNHKVPVHIWVHGGGWSGGTAAASAASYSPHGTYLAENLGVATLGISYRCHGSSGNFSLAMEDIDAAYQWAVAHADTYNFDMTKVFFSGGSAGSPLASLAAQRYDSTIGFIGFNGIYDFVNDQNSFGQWNGYGQENPSAEANSAIFQLRENPPATLVVHGDEDTTIPYTQSTLFANAINAAGGEAKAIIYPRQVHAFFNPNQEEYEDVLHEMVNFMAALLKDENQTLHAVEPTALSKPLLVFPNPIKQGQTLELRLGKNLNTTHVQVQVLNMAGQILINDNILVNKQLIQLQTQTLKEGHYVLKIWGNSVAVSKKFMVH